MANRHLARSVVLQTLFEWDTTHADASEAKAILSRNIEEFGGEGADTPFMEMLLNGVIAKKEDIDLIITKAAPDWPLDKISIVDRNVLRLGLYELLFADRNEVPAKVAINEAIELSRRYGSEDSPRFVNGVLDKIGQARNAERGARGEVKKAEGAKADPS